MRVLIRFLSHPSAGAIEQKDRRFEGEALTLGRATDQVLFIKDRRVALEHARIVLHLGRPVIRSAVAGGVVVNGIPTGEARLRQGDTLRIGDNLLRVIAPPQGFDLALTFELDPEAQRAATTVEAPRLDLPAVGWSMRRPSWISFLTIIAFTLLIPASGLMDSGVRDTLRAQALPDDGHWLSGPLATVHANVGTQCETCHRLPFQRVRNAACLDCHATTVGRHFDADTGLVTRLETARCASCHAEHNEPATLLRRDEKLCVQCHANLVETAGPGVTAQDTGDFATAHPEFRVSLRVPPDQAGQKARTIRLPLDRAELRERSRLKFSHLSHLLPEGVDSPQGIQVLNCGNCHQPAAEGTGMQPIRMQQHCAQCHRLDFDPAFPDATIPHGDASVVMKRLVEYYSRSFLESYPDPQAGSPESRSLARPGRPLSTRQRDWLLEKAKTRAEEIARDLFERRTCQGCHEVGGNGSVATPWRVAPVQLTERYFPAAHFSHARHDTALTACEDCHRASTSENSSDVLIPTITTCRDCHGSGDSRRVPEGKVTSDCVMCHRFHQSRHGAWTAPEAQ